MTPAPENLGKRLDAAAPTAYPAVPVEEALRRGRQIVRRRRVGAVLVTAVVVAAIAVASTALIVRRLDASLVPADQSKAVSHVSFSLYVDADGAKRDYVVSVLPPEQGIQVIEYGEQTAAGLKTVARSQINPTTPKVTWGYAPGSQVLLGVLPSAGATHVEIESAGGGGTGPEITPIPGTGYAAFAFVTEKPLMGRSAVTSVRWFDEQGRPVDTEGRVGAVAQFGGHQVWLSADGSRVGERDDTGNSSSTTLTEPLPVLFSTTIDSTHLGWWFAVVVPPTALSGTVVLVDGSEHPFTSTALGDRRVFSVSGPPKTGSVGIISIRWIDSANVQHTLTR